MLPTYKIINESLFSSMLWIREFIFFMLLINNAECVKTLY